MMTVIRANPTNVRGDCEEIHATPQRDYEGTKRPCRTDSRNSFDGDVVARNCKVGVAEELASNVEDKEREE